MFARNTEQVWNYSNVSNVGQTLEKEIRYSVLMGLNLL